MLKDKNEDATYSLGYRCLLRHFYFDKKLMYQHNRYRKLLSLVNKSSINKLYINPSSYLADLNKSYLCHSIYSNTKLRSSKSSLFSISSRNTFLTCKEKCSVKNFQCTVSDASTQTYLELIDMDPVMGFVQLKFNDFQTYLKMMKPNDFICEKINKENCVSEDPNLLSPEPFFLHKPLEKIQENFQVIRQIGDFRKSNMNSYTFDNSQVESKTTANKSSISETFNSEKNQFRKENYQLKKPIDRINVPILPKETSKITDIRGLFLAELKFKLNKMPKVL